MRDVYIVGIHTIKFGKYLNQSIKALSTQAVRGALADASLDQRALQSVWFANSGWGESSYQHCIRGQVALRPMGIDALPITNVENACAGGSTAFHGAWKDVASGLFDVSMAVGAEKIHSANRFAVFAGFLSGTDVENIVPEAKRLMADIAASPTSREPVPGMPAPSKAASGQRKSRSLSDRWRELRDQLVTGIRLGETLGYPQMRELAAMSKGDHSPFMDIYGFKAREHMRLYGSTPMQLAIIASKNHWHSSMNPNAQYQFEVSPEQVLADRIVSPPLTRAMCAPIGDGAAAAIVMSEEAARRHGLMGRAVRVRASILGSGRERADNEPDIGERLAKIAYERAGLGPQDIDCVELHDATAYGELHQTEALGFFAKGEGGRAAERGDTKIGGRIPVNTSGGLLSRGHPIGASGLAQIHELATQLRGEAGKRQVQGARLALAENGGGAIAKEEAAMCIHILESTRGQ